MRGNLKLKLTAVALVAIALTLLMPSTLAYYSTVGTTTNVVTSGGVEMFIHETTDQNTPFPSGGVYVVPGEVVSKRVSIQSNCTHPFYLRVKIVSGVSAQALPAEDCFELDIREEYWQLHDGWYYYKGIVNPGELTPYVFSKVGIVGAAVDNRYLGETLTLSVIAQAVQSENNPIEGDATYTASGWPSEGEGGV